MVFAAPATSDLKARALTLTWVILRIGQSNLMQITLISVVAGLVSGLRTRGE